MARPSNGVPLVSASQSPVLRNAPEPTQGRAPLRPWSGSNLRAPYLRGPTSSAGAARYRKKTHGGGSTGSTQPDGASRRSTVDLGDGKHQDRCLVVFTDLFDQLTWLDLALDHRCA